jgi:hypothetical protein
MRVGMYPHSSQKRLDPDFLYADLTDGSECDFL